MKYFLLPFAFLFMCFSLRGQNYQFLGSKVYGGDKGELSNHLFKFNENKLLMVGESFSNISGNKTTSNCSSLGLDRDIWLVMVDLNFDIVWQKSLGGTNNEYNAMAINDGNGNILVSCMSLSDSSCTRNTQLKGAGDIILYMLDSMGTTIWEKNFGTVDDCFGNKIVRLSDGNFVMITTTNANIGYDKTSPSKGGDDIWLVKFESNGNIIYDKTYGGNSNERPAIFDNQTNIGFIESSLNELTIITNTTSSNSIDVTDTTHGANDFWMFTIDSLGNKLSDYCYGGSINDYFASGIKSSNGYLLGGSTISPQGGSIDQPPILPFTYSGWIISVDTSGNKLWDKRYQSGATISTGGETLAILDIIPASNGQYWVTSTVNTIGGNDVSEPPYGTRDAWVFKIDSTGAILWDKRFGSSSQTFTSNSVLMADSSIFLFCAADTGITNVKAELGYGASDYYLVHFRYDNVTTFVSEITSSLELIYLYPNPASNNFFIKHSSEVKIQFVDILSMSGQVVKSFGTACSNYNIEDLPNAVYLCRIKTNKGEVFRKISRL